MLVITSCMLVSNESFRPPRRVCVCQRLRSYSMFICMLSVWTVACCCFQYLSALKYPHPNRLTFISVSVERKLQYSHHITCNIFLVQIYFCRYMQSKRDGMIERSHQPMPEAWFIRYSVKCTNGNASHRDLINSLAILPHTLYECRFCSKISLRIFMCVFVCVLCRLRAPVH